MNGIQRVFLAMLLAVCGAAGQTATRNVVLVTADGLRWQELFGGIDPLLMNAKETGMADAGHLRKKLWRESPVERRTALMPFFWKTLAPAGVVLGNAGKGSSVKVTNAYRVSYPGYAEILTGRAQDSAIRGNDPIRNPAITVLEFIRERLGLRQRQVALFASWRVFDVIGEHRPGAIFINAGYSPAEGSARTRELSALQFRALTPWDETRHDYITLELALEHLRTEKPRAIYIALGETDDWAHSRRYDRVLGAIEYFDEALRQIWMFIEQTPEYRGCTSVVITSDHGRGSTLEDWHGHGAKVSGAEQIWIAVAGPDTPAVGEASDAPPAFQRDVAPTMLDLLGIDYREYKGVEGRPIPAARSR
jgi:hypothetical protein